MCTCASIKNKKNSENRETNMFQHTSYKIHCNYHKT